MSHAPAAVEKSTNTAAGKGKVKTYLRMLKWLLPYSWAIVVAAVFLVVTTALSFVSLAAFMPLVDIKFSPDGGMASLKKIGVATWPYGEKILSFFSEIFEKGDSTVIYMLAAFIVVAVLIRCVSDFFHAYLIAYIMNMVSVDISKALYTRILNHSVLFFMHKGVGNLISRFTNDIEQMRRGAVIILIGGLKEPLKMGVNLILIFAIDYQLAILSLAVLPITTYIIYKLGRGIKKRSLLAWEKTSTLTSVLQESLSAIRVIKAFSTEKLETGRFWNASRDVFRHLMKMAKFRASSAPVIEFIYTTAFAAILVAALRGERGTSEFGGFVVFFAALGTLYTPLRRLAKIHIAINQGIAGGERVFEIMDLQPDIEESAEAREISRLEKELAFRNVFFSYDDSGKVLDGVSFTVPKGKTTAIVGLSGEGKTTIVNMLLRFYDPTSGSIEIDGVDIREATFTSLRRQMGIVTQEVTLFNDTIYNNIAYGLDDISRDKVISAANAAQVNQFVDSLPDGYDTVVGEGAARLSRGQRQRIAIARAIVRNPAILILDEATSSLDAYHSSMLFDALSRFMRERATILISHQLSHVRTADQILVLRKGLLIGRGTHKALLASCDFYRDLYEKQDVGRDE